MVGEIEMRTFKQALITIFPEHHIEFFEKCSMIARIRCSGIGHNHLVQMITLALAHKATIDITSDEERYDDVDPKSCRKSWVEITFHR